MKHFDHVFCILFFSIKNKWRVHATYPKREVPLQAPKSLFWEHPLKKLWSLAVATPLGMSRGKLHIRFKWQNINPCLLHGLAWYCCLFVYLCLKMFVWYFCLCCHVCLLRAFPNCYSVCHQNNKNVCNPLNNMVVVTMNHRSSLDLGTHWWTHQLIDQSH